MSYFQHPKRSHRRALGLFLLASPLAGIAFQPSSVQAQPAPTIPPKKSLKPFSAEQKAAIDKVMVIARLENLCQTRIDLKVENATLEDVVARVKQALQDETLSIEVRGARPVRVGFELEDTSVGDALTHVTALAGCKLFLLRGGLLIAPLSQLTDAEKSEIEQRQGGEWAKSVNAGGNGWTNKTGGEKLFASAIAQEITGSDAKPKPATVEKTAFSNFSPDSQKMLQQLARWTSDSVRSRHPDAPPLRLTAGSTVVVDTSNPKSIQISFPRGESEPSAISVVTNIYLP